MRIVFTVVTLFALLVSATAKETSQKQTLLARFEVTKVALDTKLPRHALMLYSNGREIESVRFEGKDKQTSGIGTFESMRLLHRLEKLNLPKMDYQKYFDNLAKRPRKPGKDYVVTMDGHEVEVELRIKGTTVRFKMWNPNSFFYNHDDDKIANSVNTAIEAIVLTLGKSSVYF